MFPIRHIHQIEMTSRCNLRCRYCPSPHLPRPKIDMTEAYYKQTLRWARHFMIAAGGQRELNLAGIGESTLHPDFVRFVFLAREAMGDGVMLALATNGLLMTDELAAAIAPARPAVWVSMHRPEKAGPAVEVLKKHNLLYGVSVDPALAAIDWAGQVKWHVSAGAKRECQWVKHGRVFVMADGRVSRCCLDASGVGVFAHVDDDLRRFETSPYVLCRTCDQDVGVPFEQEQVA